MRIRGLGVIGDAVLDLHPGFTVVTGETGAGKTMVVSGLGLLLGARADAAAVRAGFDAALVEGRVVLPPGSPVAAAAVDAGAELDDGVLLLTRSVSSAGRSRAHAGGRSVPVAVLAELAAELVTVHGQSDQLRLLQPSRQRAALDRYAGHDELVAEVADTHAALREVEGALQDVLTRGRERAQEADLLRFGLAEVEAVAPLPGEDHALRDEDTRLGNADALRAAATQAHAQVQGGELAPDGDAADAITLVAAARRALDPMRSHDRSISEIDDRLAEVQYLLADIAGDLASYAAAVDDDPARLAAVQQRRAALTALTRKYGEDVDAVLAWAERASLRLLELDDDSGRLEQLRQRREHVRSALGVAAARLGDSREAAAQRLAELVTVELGSLAMPHARLDVQVTRRDVADGLDVPFASGARRVAVGPEGADDVELLLAAHAGAPVRPLAKGASGGELSRVMLGLEVVLAGADPVPTFVFDEVDAGVGGRAAVEIGRRLARLARGSQVIVVTHLPQVAAYADRHLLVEKSDDGAVSESGVSVLSGDERLGELARMLAGQEGSTTARAHAQELVASAQEHIAAIA